MPPAQLTENVPLSSESPRPVLLPLLFVVVLGAGLRLLWIETPLLDGHRWRQVDTAAIARNLYEVQFNPFYPQVDWGGLHGYVETEFPLLPTLTAALYYALGEQDHLGRIVAVLFSVATIVATYALGAELLGAAGGGLAAAFLFAVSPAAVFFGRTFMPDAPMLFFWVAGVLGFVRYFKRGDRRALWLGSAAAALACLGKLPAVMMFAPIAAAAFQARRWSVLRDRQFLAALAVPLVIAAAWYLHAYLLFRQTGLTFGILAHPAKTYPLSVAPGPWQYAFSKWSTVELLTTRRYYVEMFGRMHHFHLLPWGLGGALLGLAFWKRSEWRLVADAWLLAMLAFLLVAGEANISHEYYQLPMIPLAGLYLGAVAGPVFGGDWTLRKGRGLIRPVVLATIGIAGFYYSGVIVSHFRPDRLDMRVLLAGAAVQRVVPEDALVVVVDDYGVTSPMLLYFAHRKGWSFGVENLRPQVIDGLKRQGARFFATSLWSRVEAEQPETAYYLKTFPRLELGDAPADMAVFDLTARE